MYLKTGFLMAGLALSGCAQLAEHLPSADAMAWENIQVGIDRQLQTVPFQAGAVSVVTTEHGELHTYTLVPCRNGTHICANSLRGRAGHLSETQHFFVVSGAYPNRTFYLEPGGDGVLVKNGAQLPLAWE